jgi:dihydrofolate reductase
LNGKIADQKGDFSPYSSPEDQDWLKQKIRESDVLVMGRKTFERHAQHTSKPVIVFTTAVRGIRIGKGEEKEIHWFNDEKQELINLCRLLQYKTITILGGARVYHWFFEQKLVSDVYLTVEPYLISHGRPILEGDWFVNQKNWKLYSSKTLNQQGSLLLHYQP